MIIFICINEYSCFSINIEFYGLYGFRNENIIFDGYVLNIGPGNSEKISKENLKMSMVK